MKLPTPEHIKSRVIDAWMKGKSRDKIASEFNISTGSVSNIKEQWQNKIGAFDANNLRELGLALKKAGISPVQCANGLRINNKSINYVSMRITSLIFYKNCIMKVKNKDYSQLMLQDWLK